MQIKLTWTCGEIYEEIFHPSVKFLIAQNFVEMTGLQLQLQLRTFKVNLDCTNVGVGLWLFLQLNMFSCRLSGRDLKSDVLSFGDLSESVGAVWVNLKLATRQHCC